MEFSQIPSAAPATPPAAEAPKAEAPKKEVETPKTAAPVLKEEAKAEAKKPETAVEETETYIVNGKETKLTKAQARELVQKAAYTDQQMKEAAQMKAAVKGLLEKLKTPNGLKEVLSDPAIGQDWKKWAIDMVREQMEEEQKDPKDRELEMTRKELEAYKKKEAEEAERRTAEEQKAKIQATAAQLRNEIVAAMDANPSLPKSQANMDRMIAYMRAAYRKTGKVLPAAEAAKLVLSDWRSEMNALLKGRKPEELQDLFDEDNLSVVEKIKLAKLKKANEADLKGDQKKAPVDIKTTKKGRVTERELEKNWKNIIAGL